MKAKVHQTLQSVDQFLGDNIRLMGVMLFCLFVKWPSAVIAISMGIILLGSIFLEA